MKKACLALVFTALMAGSATAAPPLVDHWNGEILTGVLRALGADGIKDATLSGESGLLANAPGGVSLGLYAKACGVSNDGSGDRVCRGIEGVVLFDAGNAANRALLVDKLNHDHATGKFMIERDGSILMTRYLNLDGGISQANLKAELADFFAVAAAAKQTVWNAPSR